MGHHRLKVRYHLLNARPALLLGFMQTSGVGQNPAVTLQLPQIISFAMNIAAISFGQKGPLGGDPAFDLGKCYLRLAISSSALVLRCG